MAPNRETVLAALSRLADAPGGAEVVSVLAASLRELEHLRTWIPLVAGPLSETASWPVPLPVLLERAWYAGQREGAVRGAELGSGARWAGEDPHERMRKDLASLLESGEVR